MTVKVPKLISDITPQIQEAHSNSLPKKNVYLHISCANCKNLWRNPERKRTPYVSRENKRITFDFCSGTMEKRREWSEIFKVLRVKKKNKLSLTYNSIPWNLILQKRKREFLQQTMIEFVVIRYLLPETLKEVLQRKEKLYRQETQIYIKEKKRTNMWRWNKIFIFN